MIAWDAPIFVLLGVVCLVLNWYAFRGSAKSAGHGRGQMLKMAAIWLTVFSLLAVLIERFAA